MCKPAACLVLGQALFRLLIKCKPRALLLGLELSFPALSSWVTKYLSGAGTSLLGSFANADPILNRRAENRDFCFTVENVGVMLSWFFIITQECPLNKKMTVHTRKISLRFVISFCSTKLDFIFEKQLPIYMRELSLNITLMPSN